MDILLPSGWQRPSGYSNGVSARGRIVFVAGQIGWDESGHIVSDDLTAQVSRALENTVKVLRAGGADARHIARMTWYLTDKDEYLGKRAEIGEVYRAIIGTNYPAMSLLIVKDLLEIGAKVEIETTAVVPEI
jgi:enamine deaminase RidA (YjgF/YER057c/UK114 family)